MYLVCKWIHENTDVRVLLTGEISDELFGHKYTDFAAGCRGFSGGSRKAITLSFIIMTFYAPTGASPSTSLEARVPFGDLDFADYVMRIDPALKNGIHTAKANTSFAPRIYLADWPSETILWRESSAFSDAVGHLMVDVLKAYAESLYTDEEFETLRAKYTHAQLLYKGVAFVP